MNESEFVALAEAELTRIERTLEASGVDADVERKGDGVLEIEFADGSKMIVNRHTAAREIWVAARSGGFHFRRAEAKQTDRPDDADDARWCDTRDRTELYAALSALVSEQSGESVVLTRPDPG